MSTQTNRRTFIIKLSQLAAVASTGAALSACGGSDQENTLPIAEFNYGVASGDPLQDRVILWTHAKIPQSEAEIQLIWEIAKDAAFTQIIASGLTNATAQNGHTAKIDATGLSAGQEYFYRFRQKAEENQAARISPIGKTRTLPAGGVSEINLAVMSCSNYPAGYFHAYSEITKSPAQFAIHLGDFIYEYAAGEYASQDAEKLNRIVNPTKECITLEDYRQRYAQYRSDPDSKTFSAAMPIIAVWDDHEIANDTYSSGAENHSQTEGSWQDRRNAAIKAWHEWLPVRTPDTNNPDQLTKIYRSFNFGNLLSLHMLETRLIAREKPITLAQLANPVTAASAMNQLASSDRQLLGSEQLQWLQNQMYSSTATWQVLGQQVLMARMTFPVSVLNAINPDTLTNATDAQKAAAIAQITEYITAKQTAAYDPAQLTAAQQALLDERQNPKLGYNLDAWDGYPAEREKVLRISAQLNKKLIVLAGDTHNAWQSELTLMSGEKVGHEFATHSISSPGLEEYLNFLPPEQVAGIFTNIVDDLKYCETSKRGYLLMTFTQTNVTGKWTYLSTIKEREYTTQQHTITI